MAFNRTVLVWNQCDSPRALKFHLPCRGIPCCADWIPLHDGESLPVNEDSLSLLDRRTLKAPGQRSDLGPFPFSWQHGIKYVFWGSHVHLTFFAFFFRAKRSSWPSSTSTWKSMALCIMKPNVLLRSQPLSRTMAFCHSMNSSSCWGKPRYTMGG